MTNDFVALRRSAPCVLLSCCYCPNLTTCTDVVKDPNIRWAIDAKDEWLVNIQCNDCGTQWGVCNKCNKIKTIFRDKRFISRHRFLKHKIGTSESPVKQGKKRKQTSVSSVSDHESTEKSIEPSLSKNSKASSTKSNLTYRRRYMQTFEDGLAPKLKEGMFLDAEGEVLNTHQVNITSANYYGNEANKMGTSNLIGDALNVDRQSTSPLSPTEINIQLLISRLVSSQTERQNRIFAEILNHLKNDLSIHTKSLSNKVMRYIPTTKADIDRIYISATAPKSISNNLPKPVCHMLKDHSIISLRDIVANFFLQNEKELVSLDKWQSVVSSDKMPDDCIRWFRNKRTETIIKEAENRRFDMSPHPDKPDVVPIIPLFLCLWSDDFEPNKSIKSNRQSVWIKTCTIKGLSCQYDLISDTYPVAISEKGVDHEEVEHALKYELEWFSQEGYGLFYSSYHKSPVYVHLDLYCSKMDQPERRSALRLMGGNSLVHGRFGYLVDCRQNVNKIRSCKECTTSIVQEHSNGNHGKVPFWRTGTCVKCTAWMINPVNNLLAYKVEQKDTKNFPKEAYDFSNNTISPKRIQFKEMYVATRVVLSNLTAVNWEGETWTSQQCKTFLKYTGYNTKAVADIIQRCNNIRNFNEIQSNHTKYNPEPLAAIMKEKDDNPEKYEPFSAPSSWYHFNDTSVFVDVPMHLLFLGIVKTVTLDLGVWLKSVKKHGPFCRMINSILDPVRSLNISWCKLLKYSEDRFGGWVSENYSALCRLTNWIYSSIDNLPRLTYSPIAPELVLKVLYFMNLMISKSLTVKTEDEITSLETIIRCFFINYDCFVKSITNTNNPGWITSYNFLSLLNIPDTLRMYGCMRPLWEGGMDGESYLKIVKREVKNGLRRQWKLWLLENLLKEKTFTHLLNQHIPNRVQVINEFKTYDKKDNIKKQLRLHKVMSAFRINDDKLAYYMAYRDKNKIVAVKLNVKNDNIVVRNYEQYRRVVISKNEHAITDIVGNKVGCLFLPYLRKPNEDRNHLHQYYCIVSSDWT